MAQSIAGKHRQCNPAFCIRATARIEVPCRDGRAGNPEAGMNAALVVVRKKDWDVSPSDPIMKRSGADFEEKQDTCRDQPFMRSRRSGSEDQPDLQAAGRFEPEADLEATKIWKA